MSLAVAPAALLFTVCLSAAFLAGLPSQQRAAADLLTSGGYSAVLPIGDEQYNCGELSAFNAVYDPTWGRVKSISKPVVGDNEYVGSTCSTPGAEGYYTYFGDAASPREPGCRSACKGYYSYDLGSWHIVALNSECSAVGVGGCDSASVQGKWLKADLAAHPAQCTLAYWHRPYWSEGGPRSVMKYEVRNSGTYGVLKLTLHAGSYDWQFVPEAGKTFTDTGSQNCH